jgi:hypothetical protein
MNPFYEHHKDNNRFGHRCFDRLLLNGLIQPFQQPERVIGFFNTFRRLYPVSRDVLREIARQFQKWVLNRSLKWGAPILEAPTDRRDKFMDPYFRKAKPNQVVAILKGRQPARIMIAIGNKKDNRWHLQMAQRWVVQYSFYVNDDRWGRMLAPMCPYLPFSACVCLNQHYWLAARMREEGMDFQQCTNAFVRCAQPARPPARVGGFPHRPRRSHLRSKVAGRLHSLFHRQGTPTGWMSASAVLRPSRTLRQLDFPPPCCAG